MFEVFYSVAELHIRTNLKEEDVNQPTELMVRTHRIHGIIDVGYTEQWQYVRMSEGPPYFNLSLEALKRRLIDECFDRELFSPPALHDFDSVGKQG
jgi:hypothetical protein